MKLCLCRQAKSKSKSFRRDRRGVSSVVGSVFFFSIAIMLISFFYEVAQNQILMQQYDAEKVRENIDAVILVTAGGIRITIENRGAIAANVTRLWVVDETINAHRSYALNTTVFPWVSGLIDSATIPGFTPLDETHKYSIRVVTARGNILEPTPFTGITGQVITTIGYPPWVSSSMTSIDTNSTETPVAQISRDDNGRSYDGGDVFLSIKNVGSIPFFLTDQSKLIFKSATTGKVYAARLIKWYQVVNKVVVGSAVIDPGKDSKAIYSGDVFILQFDAPQEAPGAAYNIPWNPPYTGAYYVYLHLEGYDDNGNAYFQDVYYGLIPQEGPAP